MSVRKEQSGRRSIQVEAEVPGAPEEVWQAIATGSGVSSWFVPTRSDERVGGTITSQFGPGMDSAAAITAWDPPHRFAAESQSFGPDAPPMATEWVVEARSGGTCIVRVVHSMFAATDDWDNQLESIESGWPTFFRILHRYLTEFRGQPCSIVQLMGLAHDGEMSAWNQFLALLGLAGRGIGEPCSTPPGVPPLSGSVDQIGGGKEPHQLLRLQEPAPGMALLNACEMGGQVYLNLYLYLYGNGAAAAVSSQEPAWQAWMTQHFPMG